MFNVFAITLCKIVNFSQEAKELNCVRVRPLIVTIFILFNFQVIQAQVRPTSPVRDSTKLLASDSVKQSLDSLTSDSTKVKPLKGDIETTINYSARDSIRVSMNNQMVWLYGDA